MYKNYIFDLYGTLVDLKTDEDKDELWKNLALFYSYNGAYYEPEEIKEKYFKYTGQEIMKNKKTEFPDIKIEKVFKKLYKNREIDAGKSLIQYTTRLFRGLSTDHIKVYEGVKVLLEKIKIHNGKIFLLSNGQREFSVPELKYMGIYDYLDNLYFSSDTGICKPDTNFFNFLLVKEGLNKEETIMIGNDHTTDIKGAIDCGIASLYIHTAYSKKEAVESYVESGIERKRASDVVKATYKVMEENHLEMVRILGL